MKINLTLKKAEINSFQEIRETLENLIPEELGFELPSLEEFMDEDDWEMDRLYRAAPYGSLLIINDSGDYEITIDLTQEFTTDTLRLVNKITNASSGIIGAVVGFAGTMKALGGKFIKKIGDLGDQFSAKWFAPPEIEETTTENSEESDASKVEEHENKYGVYPMKFLWDDNDGHARWGVVTVVVEKCDYTYGGFRVVSKKTNGGLNANFESVYEKAECQLFMELKEHGFEPMFSDFNEARLEMLNLFDTFIREMNRTSDENETGDTTGEISMDDLEKACEGSKPFENPIHEEYEKFFGGKKATE